MSDPSFGAREVPLIPGALHGMRGFTVNDDGTLSPLHRGKDIQYTQDVHKAECKLAGEMTIQIGATSFTYKVNDEYGELLHWGKDEGRVPAKNCSCGFYAYFAEAPQTPFMYGGTKHVIGIVRATGRCLVGDLGFRAEKMQIVALICDSPRTDKFNDFMRDLTDKLWKVPLSLLLTFFLVHVLGIVLNILTKQNEIFNVLGSCTTLILWSYIIVQTATTIHAWHRIRTHPKPSYLSPPPYMAKLIKEQYPDVQYFSTMEEAQKQFPISKASDLPQ